MSFPTADVASIGALSAGLNIFWCAFLNSSISWLCWCCFSDVTFLRIFFIWSCSSMVGPFCSLCFFCKQIDDRSIWSRYLFTSDLLWSSWHIALDKLLDVALLLLARLEKLQVDELLTNEFVSFFSSLVLCTSIMIVFSSCPKSMPLEPWMPWNSSSVPLFLMVVPLSDRLIIVGLKYCFFSSFWSSSQALFSHFNRSSRSSRSKLSSLTIDRRFESDHEGLWSPVTELAELL